MDGRGAGDTALGRIGERVGPGSVFSGPPPALELKEVPVGGVIFCDGEDGRYDLPDDPSGALHGLKPGGFKELVGE